MKRKYNMQMGRTETEFQNFEQAKLEMNIVLK